MMPGDIETTITQIQATVELVPEYRDILRDDPDSWSDDLRTDNRFRALVEGE